MAGSLFLFEQSQAGDERTKILYGGNTACLYFYQHIIAYAEGVEANQMGHYSSDYFSVFHYYLAY